MAKSQLSIIPLKLHLQLLITIITIYIEWCLYHCLKQPHAIILDGKKSWKH